MHSRAQCIERAGLELPSVPSIDEHARGVEPAPGQNLNGLGPARDATKCSQRLAHDAQVTDIRLHVQQQGVPMRARLLRTWKSPPQANTMGARLEHRGRLAADLHQAARLSCLRRRCGLPSRGDRANAMTPSAMGVSNDIPNRRCDCDCGHFAFASQRTAIPFSKCQRRP